MKALGKGREPQETKNNEETTLKRRENDISINKKQSAEIMTEWNVIAGPQGGTDTRTVKRKKKVPEHVRVRKDIKLLD